jgi:hypothetical protein
MALDVWVLLIITVSWGVQQSVKLLDDSGFDAQVKAYKEIGEKVNHSSNTIMFDAHFGDRLMYYGRIVGETWLIVNKTDYSIDDSLELSGKERLQQIISEYPTIYNHYDSAVRRAGDLKGPRQRIYDSCGIADAGQSKYSIELR